MTCDVAGHASPVQPVHAPVPESRDYPRYPSGSLDLRESERGSLSIDANAHMRKEAQPVRPNDSKQSFDEPISSKAVSKEAGGEEPRQSFDEPISSKAVSKEADGAEEIMLHVGPPKTRSI